MLCFKTLKLVYYYYAHQVYLSAICDTITFSNLPIFCLCFWMDFPIYILYFALSLCMKGTGVFPPLLFSKHN